MPHAFFCGKQKGCYPCCWLVVVVPGFLYFFFKIVNTCAFLNAAYYGELHMRHERYFP